VELLYSFVFELSYLWEAYSSSLGGFLIFLLRFSHCYALQFKLGLVSLLLGVSFMLFSMFFRVCVSLLFWFEYIGRVCGIVLVASKVESSAYSKMLSPGT